jgi:hypothetical protein
VSERRARLNHQQIELRMGFDVNVKAARADRITRTALDT